MTLDTKRKILVIDDDQSVCDMIARTLKTRGYEVFTETKSQEGISKAEEILPDLVFISLLLDRTNGLKVSKELHAIEKLKNVPVIMLISYKGELDLKYTSTIGIVGVLVKPAGEKDLITKAESFLGPAAVQGAEVILPEREGTDGIEAVPNGLDVLDRETRHLPDSSSRTVKIVFEPDERYSDGPDISGDDLLHATVDGMGSDARDVSLPGSSPDFGDEKMSVEEDETAFMNAEDEEIVEDGEARRGAEAISFEEFERQEAWKKMRIAALLALVVIIGISTYLGLHFFFAAKESSVAPPALLKGPVKDAPAVQKTEKAEIHETGNPRPIEDTSKGSSPVASEKNKGKNGSRPRQAPVKGRGQPAVTEKRPSDRTTEVPEVRGKGTFSVQIGYFGDLKNAESLAATMKDKGYKVTLKKEGNAGKKISYRVLVGEFNTRNEAMVQSIAILRKEGISSIPYKE